MNKKVYQTPATTAVVMAPASILCASVGYKGIPVYDTPKGGFTGN